MAQRLRKTNAVKSLRVIAAGESITSTFQSGMPVAHVYKSALGGAERFDPPDASLVEQMASGNTDALRKLSQRYGRALLLVAERILRNEADAEEVATDVLWQAWRQASTFDSARGSVSGWLMVLTRSRAIDRLRASNARKLALADSFAGEAEPDPMLGIYNVERRKIVKEAVAALQENERTLLELAYFSDLPQSEIAMRLGIPLGTIKTRMRGALIKLRVTLAHSGVKPGRI
jgi:RNA polymerase sigma-70 factor (ECF subfamily)